MSDLASRILDRAKALGLTIATVESCTGGMVAASLTAIAGSSAVFERGWVTYSNQAKHDELGVSWQVLNSVGAVSQEVAIAMAEGALQHSSVDLAVSVTGIAGPSGGTPEKPVGTVFVALADGAGCRVKRYHFIGDRTAIRSITTFTALNWLRKYLLNLQA